MEQLILISRLLIILFCTVYCFTAFSQTIQGKAKIIDGDTIHIGKNKIRLHGIDAPEINQTCSINDQIWNCGIKSSLALENLILEKEVRCEVIDIDRYKRFIAIFNHISVDIFFFHKTFSNKSFILLLFTSITIHTVSLISSVTLAVYHRLHLEKS